MALIRITRYWDGITTLYETEAENIRAAVVKASRGWWRLVLR